MSELIEIPNDEAFQEEVLNSTLPVLIDFWAPWCNPCKMILPAVEFLSQKYSGSLKVVKVNVDNQLSKTEKYGVRGIPTLILLKNGNELAREVGVKSKEELVDFLEKNVPSLKEAL